MYIWGFGKEKWIWYIKLLSKKATHCHRLCEYNYHWQAKIEEHIQGQLHRLSLFFQLFSCSHRVLCLFAGKWNEPKELKSSEATCLTVRCTDGTGEVVSLFPEIRILRSLKPYTPQEMTEDMECGTWCRILSKEMAGISKKIKAW